MGNGAQFGGAKEKRGPVWKVGFRLLGALEKEARMRGMGPAEGGKGHKKAQLQG